MGGTLIVKPFLSKRYQDFVSIVNFLISLTTITLATIDHDYDTFDFEASPWFLETSRSIIRAIKQLIGKFLIEEVEASLATSNTCPWISNVFSSDEKTL